jgi:hypothetical protein
MGENEWTMPEWMEPYREQLESDLGGNTVENLLNDHKSTAFNNVIRAGLICMADSKVRLLHGLRKRGQLSEGAVQ